MNNEWKLRLLNEASMYEDNCFITLTYRKEDLEPLSKEVAQKFIKRLRKRLEPKLIRYYLVGDYGEENERPHYHALIFGWSPEEKDLYEASRFRGKTYYASKLLGSLWPYGFNVVGDVTPASCGYVAGYVRRAVLSDRDERNHFGRLRPFAMFSKGIGRGYCDEHASSIRQSLSVVEGKKRLGLPRYYAKRLGITADEYALERTRRLGLDVELYGDMVTVETVEEFQKSVSKEIEKVLVTREKLSRSKQ